MAKDNTSMAGAFPPGAPRGAAASKSAAAAPAVGPVQQEATAGKEVSKGTAALKRFDAARLAVKQTSQALLHTSETLGATFIGSMAEGYLGPEKLKVGGLDVRAPIGLAAQAFGLYSIATGEKRGEHALAIGSGVSASWLASVGREAGHALKERKTPASPAPAQPPGSMDWRYKSGGIPQGRWTGRTGRGESPRVRSPAGQVGGNPPGSGHRRDKSGGIPQGQVTGGKGRGKTPRVKSPAGRVGGNRPGSGHRMAESQALL